jgi:hypothetical protein
MEMSGQLHAAATLSLWKQLLDRLNGPQRLSGRGREEKYLVPARNQIPNRSGFDESIYGLCYSVPIKAQLEYQGSEVGYLTCDVTYKAAMLTTQAVQSVIESFYCTCTYIRGI